MRRIDKIKLLIKNNQETIGLSIFMIVIFICCMFLVSNLHTKLTKFDSNNKIPITTLYENWCDDESCYSRETSRDEDNKYYSEKVIKRSSKNNKLIYEKTTTIRKPQGG